MTIKRPPPLRWSLCAFLSIVLIVVRDRPTSNSFVTDPVSRLRWGMRYTQTVAIRRTATAEASVATAAAAAALVAAGANAITNAGLRSRSTELRDLILDSSSVELYRGRIDELIQELAAAKAPFDANALSGGLWKAAYTSGASPKWERNAKLVPFLRNIAGQEYNLDSMRVVNYGELVGRNVFFSARGSFSETDVSVRNCPKDYDVFVEAGALNLLGAELPLPIKGRGYLRCLYADSYVRIFTSPKDSPDRWEEEGLVVVQIPMTDIEPSWIPPYRNPS